MLQTRSPTTDSEDVSVKSEYDDGKNADNSNTTNGFIVEPNQSNSTMEGYITKIKTNQQKTVLTSDLEERNLTTSLSPETNNQSRATISSQMISPRAPPIKEEQHRHGEEREFHQDEDLQPQKLPPLPPNIQKALQQPPVTSPPEALSPGHLSISQAGFLTPLSLRKDASSTPSFVVGASQRIVGTHHSTHSIVSVGGKPTPSNFVSPLSTSRIGPAGEFSPSPNAVVTAGGGGGGGGGNSTNGGSSTKLKSPPHSSNAHSAPTSTMVAGGLGSGVFLHFDKKLADCVKQYPCLYDSKTVGYKDKNTANKAWELVAKEVEVENGKSHNKVFVRCSSSLSQNVACCILHII